MALLTLTHSARRSAAARIALAVCALLAGLCVVAPPVLAQKADPNELRAAFVFQFTNYVEWPKSAFKDATSPIVIGIVENQGMAKLLTTSVRGKTVGERGIEIVDVTSKKEAETCHILFINAADDKKVDDFLSVTRAKPVLTVSDDNNFTAEGGVIRLYEQANKLRIEINVDEAERAGLTISSKLLSLARVVQDKT